MFRFFVIFLLLSNWLLAHSEDDDLYVNISLEISKNPGNAKLYFERSEILVGLREFDKAMKDLVKAEILDSELTDFSFYKGRILVHEKKYDEALQLLNEAIDNAKEVNSEALILRGRAFAATNKFKSACQDFETAVKHHKDLSPTLILEHAQVYLKMKTPEMATKIIQNGIDKIGPSIVLYTEKVNIFEEMNSFEKAAKQIDDILKLVNRKEIWLIKRAEMNIKANLISEAKKDIDQCLQNLDKLPEVIRKRKINVKLRQKAKELLKKIQ